MKENILNLILKAENDYHHSVQKAVDEADLYADGCKEEQGAYLESLQEEWYLFEKSENEVFKKKLSEAELKLEAKLVEDKEQLKLRQQNKAGQISERLKREVLSLTWQ